MKMTCGRGGDGEWTTRRPVTSTTRTTRMCAPRLQCHCSVQQLLYRSSHLMSTGAYTLTLTLTLT